MGVLTLNDSHDLSTRYTLCRDVTNFLEVMRRSVKEDVDLSANTRWWINGICNILRSRPYINGNVDDLLWFRANGLTDKDVVLDFGAGSGYISLLLARLVKEVHGYEYVGNWIDQHLSCNEYVQGFEFCNRIVQKIRPNVRFSFYRRLPLPAEDAEYDSVVMYATLEHIERDLLSATLSEIRRVMKPNGRLFIAMLPRRYSYQECVARLLKIDAHSNLFDKTIVYRTLMSNNFKILRIERTGLSINYPQQIADRLFPLTQKIERVLIQSPVSLFSHDYRVVAVQSRG